jgi:hypothetical protein
VGLLRGFADGDGDLAGSARVGQRCRGGLVAGGAVAPPAFGAGDLGGHGLDRGGAGGDAPLPGGVVAGRPWRRRALR